MLSQKTKDIVKATAPVLQDKGVEITTRMYARMAEEQPELKALFANTRDGQADRLAAAVLAYAQNIEELEALGPSVAAIAKKHVYAKVLPEHYPVVGGLLIAAMKDVLGDAVTDEIIQAWSEAYSFLADIFIEKEKELSNA
ncbi:MAG: globin domain-containing protein [Gammaproteobacteria bacterium]